jgi:hypothetical protein
MLHDPFVSAEPEGNGGTNPSPPIARGEWECAESDGHLAKFDQRLVTER